MARQYILSKEDFKGLMSEVMKTSELIAPVRGDETKLRSRSMFRKIEDPSEIWLDGIVYFPVKYYFFSKKETIFEFEGNKIIDPKLKIPNRVFFGLRRCDLNGIYHQDIVFLDENPDPFYKARREKSLLIGLHCKEGDDYCFCNSMDLKDFFDLMFYDKGDFYAVEVGSEKGQKFINAYASFFQEKEGIITDEDRKIVNKKKLEKKDIADLYNHKKWEELAEKCLSCGACNILCPNCHCFTVYDEVEFDLKRGRRVRVPASCQLMSFTRVAGEHIFRKDKVARFKHRIYHQIQYFRDRHGIDFCTGCGRCIRECPAKIDWVEAINTM